MTERGVVYKLKGSRAVVRFDRRSACDSCHMCAVTRDGMKVEVTVENTLSANVGDFVSVEMAERFVLTAAAIVYIIPLVLTGIGLLLGGLINDLAQILMSIGGLVLGFTVAFLLDRFVIRKRKSCAPQMKELLSSATFIPSAPLQNVTSVLKTDTDVNNIKSDVIAEDIHQSATDGESAEGARTNNSDSATHQSADFE